MKNLLRTIPLHAFLIGPYIISFIWIRNIAEVTMAMTFRSVAISIIVSALLFAISYLIYRSIRKAGIFTTLLLIGFFSYGALYHELDTLFYKGLWPFAHIHRFLIIAYFVLYIVLMILLYRSKRPHLNTNFGLNAFVLVVFFMNAISALTGNRKQSEITDIKNPFLAAQKNRIDSLQAPKKKPDVYYIVLDGYASESALNRYYDVENPELYAYLRKKGFYVPDSSKANYPYTYSSLSSSLNLNYLDSLKNYNAYDLIRQNMVSYVFKQAGYNVVNIESGFAITEHLDFADKTISIAGLNEFERRLLELTILKLDDILGLNNFILLESQLNSLPLFLEEKGPKFGFIHIVSPHPPYVMDKDGNRKLRNSLSDNAWEPRQDYVAQLQYTSRKTMEFIDLVLATAEVPPIIIIQSDHGPWIKDKNHGNVYDARMGILNAYYVPEQYKSALYPGISPVNSFRFLFSELFQLDYPMLPDQKVLPDAQLQQTTFDKYAN